MQSKKILIFLLLAVCFANFYPPKNFAQVSESELTDFVCEVGIKFYKNGRFSEALKEFQTALTIDPENETAKKYIDLIKNQIAASIVISPSEEQKPSEQKPTQALSPAERIFPEAKKDQPMDEFMLKIDKELKGEVYITEEEAKTILLGQQALPKILVLDAQVKNLKFPLEIEQERAIIIQGNNIRRFLITQPEVLSAERINDNEVKFTGAGLGYTYVHIWDEQERWTLEFLTVPLRPEGPTLEEEIRISEEAVKNIRLRYVFDWSFFETGKKFSSLKRSSYAINHSFGLAGAPETPYGNLNLNFSVSASKDEPATLTYFSLGLTNGNIGPFKGFDLYTFDYAPFITNLAFAGTNLRGAMLNSPVFNNKIRYTAFYGREFKGRYAGLSPLMAEMKNSYLSGFGVSYLPKARQSYDLSAFHGWGQERPVDLYDYGYDFKVSSLFDKWNWKYETAYDTKNFSHLLKTGIKLPKGNLMNEFRDVDKTFKTMSGLGSYAGELGVLTSLSYVPADKINLSGKLDLFKDRLYPNPEDNGRWNEDLDLGANLSVNSLTNLNFNLGFQDYLGKVSASRAYSAGIGVYRAIEWVRKINTHINYRYNLNQYLNSPSQDYMSNKILLGLRFSLIGNLSYFVNEELNWVNALNTSESAQPSAFETGIDWSDQILKSRFFGNFRFIYRNEEATASALSFLSGEDYTETFAEVKYLPNPEVETFVNARVRNVWKEEPYKDTRLDLTFYSGLRYIWDTGLRWESVGAIEGYVFKDLNGDGLRQRDEAPVQGIKVWLGGDKSLVTDIFGYYKFAKVRARKAYINIDTTTIPINFVLTVPETQEVSIINWQSVQANFGIVSHTEISGMVFEDVGGDGDFSMEDSVVRGVTLKLDDGIEAVTDDYGRYIFANPAVGKHVVTLDLTSLSAVYIPTVPIFREVDLSEGMSYEYNIPVKKIEK